MTKSGLAVDARAPSVQILTKGRQTTMQAHSFRTDIQNEQKYQTFD
jgi:hypothetical protein